MKMRRKETGREETRRGGVAVMIKGQRYQRTQLTERRVGAPYQIGAMGEVGAGRELLGGTRLSILFNSKDQRVEGEARSSKGNPWAPGAGLWRGGWGKSQEEDHPSQRKEVRTRHMCRGWRGGRR